MVLRQRHPWCQSTWRVSLMTYGYHTWSRRRDINKVDNVTALFILESTARLRLVISNVDYWFQYPLESPFDLLVSGSVSPRLNPGSEGSNICGLMGYHIFIHMEILLCPIQPSFASQSRCRFFLTFYFLARLINPVDRPGTKWSAEWRLVVEPSFLDLVR